MTLTSTFSNPDAQEVQEPLHYFSKQMGLKCNLLSVLTFLGQKKKVKKSCGLGDVGNWCLLVVGDYECVPIASMLLRYQVFVSIVRGLKIEVFSWLMVACALNIERDASGTAEARLREWLHGSCTAQPDVVALPQEWKLGILLGPGVALSLEEKVTDVLVWVSGTRNLRLPFVITLQGAWNLQGHKFLGSRVYF